MTEIENWLTGRLPEEWFTAAPSVAVDKEEIVVVGRVETPDGIADEGPDGAEAAAGRISRFREQTRQERMAIAREAEHRFDRKVAWGVDCGSTRMMFTHLAVPVMTRLRQPDRQVLDTLVEAGVARSRADALAWCVRLVGQHEDDWLARLREAMTQVNQVRTEGPAA